MEIIWYTYRLPEKKLGAKNSIQTKNEVLEHLLHVGAETLQCLHVHFQQLQTEQFKKKINKKKYLMNWI